MRKSLAGLVLCILLGTPEYAWAQESTDPATPVEAAVAPVCGDGTLTPCYMLPALDWPVWDRLAQCESGQRWWIDGRFDGGLQFAPSTWRAMGGTEFAPYAFQATREQQIEVARRTLNRSGWGAWPACSRRLGYRR